MRTVFRCRKLNLWLLYFVGRASRYSSC